MFLATAETMFLATAETMFLVKGWRSTN
jgi:hypothetical protein